jgi:hypothetical protein
MKLRNLFLASALAAAAGAVIAATPASAYTACNGQGDCWHTDSRVHFPGVTLSFHDDKWGDKNRGNGRYHWHETDNDHDWHHGYWSRGEWHSG